MLLLLLRRPEDLSTLYEQLCSPLSLAAYNLENWNGTDRHHFDAIVTAQDLADTYLPAWRENAATFGGVMCSYNVRAAPSAAQC